MKYFAIAVLIGLFVSPAFASTTRDQHDSVKVLDRGHKHKHGG